MPGKRLLRDHPSRHEIPIQIATRKLVTLLRKLLAGRDSTPVAIHSGCPRNLRLCCQWHYL
jgi:hypothetical protein